MNPDGPIPDTAGESPHPSITPAPAPTESTDPAAPRELPPKPYDRWAHRRAEPRPLALLWTTFLAAATLLMLTSLVMHGGADHEIYRPAARALLAVTAVGMTVLWPMLRLSQIVPAESTRAAVAKDLVVIVAPVQAVLWPQMFFVLAYWPFEVVAALSVMLLAWNLLVGAAVVFAMEAIAALGPARTTVARAVWMGAIVAMVALGPVIGLLAHPNAGPSLEDPDRVSTWTLTSPITAVFELARDRPWTGQAAQTKPAHWAAIGIVAGISLLAWAAVWALPPRSRRFLSPEAPGGMV